MTHAVFTARFADREAHLRQRAARGWADDQDVADCLAEIDALRGWAVCMSCPAECDDHSMHHRHFGEDDAELSYAESKHQCVLKYAVAFTVDGGAGEGVDRG